jgi:16S rRNA (cytosine1402-N4)-methyltransferase
MVERVVELLRVDRGPAVMVDATVGAGGHAAALLAASGPDVHVIGFDRDRGALAIARERLADFAERLTLVHAGYDELAIHVAPVAATRGPVLGVLYDLGLSSMQLDAPGRGFAFRTDEALDMRMDTEAEDPDAAALVNGLDESELVTVIRRFGEERHARRIAAAIVAARPVASTTQLADIVRAAVPGPARHGRIHPATRTFQALRIAVNAELDRFGASLPQALEMVQPADAVPEGRGGRVGVLSYHSLEDRIAKRTFAAARGGCACPPGLPVCVCGRTPWVSDLTHGVERPSAQEIAVNARSRPAKLRVVEKTSSAPNTAPDTA